MHFTLPFTQKVAEIRKIKESSRHHSKREEEEESDSESEQEPSPPPRSKRTDGR